MNKKVYHVVIDRPMGSGHPDYPSHIYPINYGYISDIPGGDGEFQDAYVIGVEIPLDDFTGELVAIVHRRDDNETKWVIAPENTPYDKQQIEEFVYFQEQYYDSYIEMLEEEMWDAYDEKEQPLGYQVPRSMAKSLPDGVYHVVVTVYTMMPDNCFLITQRSKNKTYAMKWEATGGSLLAGETPVEGARRELEEETGILAAQEQLIEVYKYVDSGRQVIYHTFIAKLNTAAKIHLQFGETADYRLLPYNALKDFIKSDMFAPPEQNRFQMHETLMDAAVEKYKNNIPNVSHQQLQLYAITDKRWLNKASLEEQVEKALANGVTFLQLRDKAATHEELVDEAKRLKPIAEKYGVPFVVNDDVMAAKEAGADGVHIGQSDMAYEDARSVLGSDKIIGMTAKTVEQAIRAQQMGADYIGVGAVFHTDTKSDAIGMTRETLLSITDAIDIPIVAIGGITCENADYLKNTGVSGIAVVSAIFAAADIKEAVRSLRKKTDCIFSYQKKNIIFDMDGTLLDSMPYWRQLAREYALSKGAVLPDDFDKVCYSMDLNDASEYFRTVLGIKEAPEDIIKETLELMNQHYKNDIPMKPGMRRLLLKEQKNGSNMCIFTSSDATSAQLSMSRIGVRDCFTKIFTSYEIGISKKLPDSYLKVCEKMGFQPADTYVYEDVLHGVASAKKAGMKVIAVYDEDSKEHWAEIKELADDTICPV